MGWQNAKIKELFEISGSEAILLKCTEDLKDLNFYYYTELPKAIFGNLYFLIRPDSQTIYATVLEKGAIENELKADFQLELYKGKKEIEEKLQKDLGTTKKIGLNFEGLQKNSFDGLQKFLAGKEIVDASRALQKIREQKTDTELKKIKKSVKVALDVQKWFGKTIKVGLTEQQLKGLIEERMRDLGTTPSFDTIVAAGVNGRIPHHHPGSKKIKRGELLLIDFGVEWQNYCSDLTRTYVVGKASKKQKELYDLVYQASQNAKKLAKDGAAAKGLFDAAENTLKEKDFELIHGLGHGLGLKVHDYPSRMYRDSDFALAERNVVTIEPGVYAKEFGGIRLEDDVVITKNGIEQLSKVPSELIGV